MSIKYKSRLYPDSQTLLAFLGLDAGDGLPEGAVYQSDIFPPHDPEHEYVTWGVDDELNYVLVVETKPLFARIDSLGHVVSLSEVDSDGILIPKELRSFIEIGWLRVEGGFKPPSIESFQRQLKVRAIEMGEQARQTTANPVGMGEVATWLMNYVGVSLHLAGLPSPMWDAAMALESAKKGVEPEILKAIHIERAKNYHLLAGLIQGIVGEAKAAFTATDTEALIMESNRLRSEAAQAMKDPFAAIAAIQLS